MNLPLSKPISYAKFRFYAGLNDFLPEDHRHTQFNQYFNEKISIKDLIESLGIPHTEVDLLLVNQQSVDFNYHIKNGDYVSVYPPFYILDSSALSKVHPVALTEIKFVLDTHMGKLARYLRMLGFDTLYRNDFSDPELASLSADQQRILLTRDRGLLKHSKIRYGYFVRQTNPVQQLIEVSLRYDLKAFIQPFSRCIHCNGQLIEIDKKAIEQQLKPLTRKHYQIFKQCQNCQKIYWQGSHYHKMQELISRVINQSSLSDEVSAD